MSLRPGRRVPDVAGVAAAGGVAGRDGRWPPHGRALHGSLLNSVERGRALLDEAQRCAGEIIERAQREAAEVRLRAEAEGRADAAAALAARVLAQATLEAQADQRALDRSVELARILAERLLGEVLHLEPARVLALARQALKEATGARRVTFVAHPDDAAVLEGALPDLGLSLDAVRVTADAARSRGDLRLETELGVLDAELAPQLARLAAKLREAIVP